MTRERVSAKAAHDYVEIFDDVPSQHDGQDVAVVAELAAELAALGKSSDWPYEAACEDPRSLDSAAVSVGVRQTEIDRRRMQQYAAQALAAAREILRRKRRLEELARGNAVIQAQAKTLDVASACALCVYPGKPSTYQREETYRTAMALNLAERSGGTYQGKLKISKRGLGQMRR